MKPLLFCIFAYILIIMTSTIVMANEASKTETAILAGGCFWCIETDFEKLDGVISAESGYAGGDRPNPTYDNYNKPSAEYKIPHIEVIKVTYDANKLSYKDILDYHMRHIDPTDGDGQFCDRGEGYVPAIFVNNEGERKIAKQVIKETADILGQDVKVKILDNSPFTLAEDYHQDYSKKNPVRYKYYRWNCGRDQRIDALWNKDTPKNLTLNQ